MKRDFLKLADLSPAEHRAIFSRARELKKDRRQRTLEGRTLLLLFEKASTRTRISFEAAIGQLGGHAVTLPMSESQTLPSRVAVAMRLARVHDSWSVTTSGMPSQAKVN